MSLIIRDALVYIENAAFKGKVEEVELPDIEFDGIEVSALGLLGAMEVAGQLQPLSGTFTLYGYDRELLGLIGDPRQAKTVLLRGSQEIIGPNGTEAELPIAWTLQPRFLKQGLGTVNGEDATQREFEFQTNTMLVELGGQEILNIDIFDYVFAVNGENKFAAKRAALGLG